MKSIWSYLLSAIVIYASLLEGNATESTDQLIDALKNNNSKTASELIESMPTPLSKADLYSLYSAIDLYAPKGDWIPILKRLIDKNPGAVELMYQLAKTAWRAGDEETAMEWAEKSISETPAAERTLYRAAALAYALNRYEKATEWIERLLKQKPDHEDGLFLRGCIYARQGDNDRAQDFLLRVVKKNPHYHMAYFELGKLANLTGKSELAERYLRQAIHGYPFFREAMNALMISLARQKKTEELERIKPIFERMNSWDGEKVNRLWYSFRHPSEIPNRHAEELAVELTYLHREEEAKKYLEHRLTLGKTSDLQLIMLARLYFNDQQFSECLQKLQQIQSDAQKETEIYVILKAWSLLNLGNIEEAKELYNQYAAKLDKSSHLKALGAKLKERETNPTNTKPVESSQKEKIFNFVDVTERAGLSSFKHKLGHLDKQWITDAQGSGVAVADYDNDGDDDIYFVCGRPELDVSDPKWRNALFRNDKGKFTDVTKKAGVGDTGFGMCAVFGDVNNDGFLDLFVGNNGANVLYKNNGDGTFSDITRDAGVGDAGYAAASAFADIDKDGDLDLYVGNYVAFDPQKHGNLRTQYHGTKVFMGPLAFPHQDDMLYINDGAGVFTNRAKENGILASDGRTMGAVFFDIDNDANLDLYVTNDSTYNHVLKNKGNGEFEDISFLSGGAFTESGIEGASMGVISGDYDNNGYLDLFITSYEQQTDILFHNNGDCLLSDVTAPTGLNLNSRMLITWGSGFCDFDSDGWLDIFTANGHLYPQVDSLNLGLKYNQGVSFYRNIGKRFEDLSAEAHSTDYSPRNGRGAALIDYDGDGDMDIIVNNIDSSPTLLENRSPHGNWLQVHLSASSARIYGVRVVARKGDRTWTRIVEGGSSYLSQNSAVLHFGFGQITEIDDLTVYWLHQKPQTIVTPKLNARITILPTQEN